jgi:hypothetical protein
MSIATTSVKAASDDDGFHKLKEWAASYQFADNDPVVLLIKCPDGKFKTFLRKDF